MSDAPAPPPPPPPPQYSADGAWWWNGGQWVPAAQAPPSPPPPEAVAAPAPAPKTAARRGVRSNLVVLGLVVAVGGAGSIVAAYALTTNEPARRDLYGYAYMARPLEAATVQLYQLETDGQRGELLATTTTDEDGYYDFSIRADGHILMVVTSGGSYVDSATGKRVSAGDVGSLETVVAAGDERVPLTPLTTWATARATWLAEDGNPPDVSVEAAFAATSRQFNVSTISDIDPAIASDAADVRLAGVTSRELGLILAGLDLEAKSLGVSALELTDAVAADLGDGALDGKDGSAPVMIADEVPLPADAMTAGLQDAIDRFANSSANKTHLPAPQIASQAPQIDLAASGSLYVTTSTLPTWKDGVAATATIDGSGGTAPYTCQLTAGALPKGFALSPSCSVSGGSTPLLGKSTMLVSPPFTVRMTDSARPSHSVSVDLRITIVARGPTIAVSGGQCPQVGKPCSITVATAKGGTPPYYFKNDSFASGTPPMGMTVSVKGVLSGTPSRAGSYSFRVCVVDLVGASDCGQATVTVGEASPQESAPSGFPANLPAGTYHISVCTSIAGIDFNTCVDGGDFEVAAGDETALAEGLEQASEAIRSACACSVRYTAFNGTEFDMVITDPSSGGVTTIRVTRVG